MPPKKAVKKAAANNAGRDRRRPPPRNQNEQIPNPEPQQDPAASDSPDEEDDQVANLIFNQGGMMRSLRNLGQDNAILQRDLKNIARDVNYIRNNLPPAQPNSDGARIQNFHSPQIRQFYGPSNGHTGSPAVGQRTQSFPDDNRFHGEHMYHAPWITQFYDPDNTESTLNDNADEKHIFSSQDDGQQQPPPSPEPQIEGGVLEDPNDVGEEISRVSAATVAGSSSNPGASPKDPIPPAEPEINPTNLDGPIQKAAPSILGSTGLDSRRLGPFTTTRNLDIIMSTAAAFQRDFGQHPNAPPPFVPDEAGRQAYREYRGEYVMGYADPVPGRQGHWEFFTHGPKSAQELARNTLGEGNGRANWHPRTVDEPTADDVAELRARLRQTGRIDSTIGIDLVWIPECQAINGTARNDVRNPLSNTQRAAQGSNDGPPTAAAEVVGSPPVSDSGRREVNAPRDESSAPDRTHLDAAADARTSFQSDSLSRPYVGEQRACSHTQTLNALEEVSRLSRPGLSKKSANINSAAYQRVRNARRRRGEMELEDIDEAATGDEADAEANAGADEEESAGVYATGEEHLRAGYHATSSRRSTPCKRSRGESGGPDGDENSPRKRHRSEESKDEDDGKDMND